MKFVIAFSVVAVFVMACETAKNDDECVSDKFTCEDIARNCRNVSKHLQLCKNSPNNCDFWITKCSIHKPVVITRRDLCRGSGSGVNLSINCEKSTASAVKVANS